MPKPIALIFVFDQLSPLELPCYGNFFAKTPELNHLCGQGLIFHEYYPRALHLCENRDESQQRFLYEAIKDQAFSSAFCQQHLERLLIAEEDVSCIHSHLVLGLSESERSFWDLMEQILTGQGLDGEHSRSQGSLVYVSVTSDETGGNAATSNEKLDWLEETLSELQSLWHESTGVDLVSSDVLLAVCSEQGEISSDFEQADSDPSTPFSPGLSRENWAPLIVHAPGWCGEFGSRSNLLTTAADLAELVKAWLKSTIQTKTDTEQADSLFSKWLEDFRAKAASPQRIILKNEEKLGLRTEEDLLVVAHDQLLDALGNRDRQELADELELYLKPDDRFDVNDVATSHPELLQKRWNELLGNQPTE